jgi:hypothetical protein
MQAYHDSEPEPVRQTEPAAMTLPLIVGGFAQFLLPLMVGRNPEAASDTAYFLGRVAGSVLIVGLVLWFGFGRRYDPKGWWKILVVLVPIALCSHLLARGFPDRDQRQAMESIATASERMLNSDGRAAATLRHSGATGEAGEIERIMIDWFRLVAAERQKYERAITEAGVETMLDPVVLSRDPGQARVRGNLDRIRAALEDAKASDKALPRRLREALERADITPGTRADVLRGMESTLVEDVPVLERIRAIDTELYDRVERSLDILRRARWRPANGLFEFDDPQAATAYDGQFRLIQSLGAEQNRLIAEQANRARARVERMRPGRR